MARINLDYTPGQMPFPRAMHDFTILVREGEEGEGREEPVGRPFTFTRSIRPTPLRTIYSHGQRRRRDIKKKGQCKMYRYYPPLDVTFASLYSSWVGDSVLIPSIDEKSTFNRVCNPIDACLDSDYAFSCLFNARFFTLFLPSSILAGENSFEVELKLKVNEIDNL